MKFGRSVEVLVSKVEGKLGLVTDLTTFIYGRGATSTDFARRIHPHGMCYIELNYHLNLDFSLPYHDGGFGICHLANGEYWIGGYYISHSLTNDPPMYIWHGAMSRFDSEGTHYETYKYKNGFRKKQLANDKAVARDVFLGFYEKLKDDCWYGDCQNGFGIKLTDSERHSLSIGDWESGERYTTYDSRGNRRSEVPTNGELSTIAESLEKSYSEPMVMKTGWCFSGDCRQGYGVLLTKKGETYKGFFKQSKFDGAGRLLRKDASIYTGNWSEGYQHGQGEEVDNRGHKMNGNYYLGKRSGTFLVTYRNGSYQEIVYRNDEAIAHGTITFDN